jgi:hypothetical protein
MKKYWNCSEPEWDCCWLMPMSSNIGTGQNAPRANGRRSAQKYFEDITDKLLAAIFDKFKEHLPPLVSLRQSYSSDAILERVEEYFEGEDLTALRKFVGKFLDRQPARPRQVDECKAFELAAPEIYRLERYESRAWSRQMRAIRNFIEIKRAEPVAAGD